MENEKDPIINRVIELAQPLIDEEKYITVLPGGEFSEDDIPILAEKFPRFGFFNRIIQKIESEYRPRIDKLEDKIDKLNTARGIYYDK